MGDQVCVDLCSLMKPGVGLLVGSFARGSFLVHSECLESNCIVCRPLRVNAVEMDQELYATDVEWMRRSKRMIKRPLKSTRKSLKLQAVENTEGSVILFNQHEAIDLKVDNIKFRFPISFLKYHHMRCSMQTQSNLEVLILA